jgi:hypothetical protein
MTLDDGKGEGLAVGDRVRVNASDLTVTASVIAGDRSSQMTFETGQMLEGIVTALSVHTASVHVTSPRDLGDGKKPIDFPRSRVSLKK